MIVNCDRALAVAIRLARSGYGGGDPERILRMRVDYVMAAIQYETFRSEFERTFVEMNRERT